MEYLKISSQGLLDMNIIHLLGGTTKDNDENKIGTYGTGLKYSFSYLLRENIDFKLFIGNEKIKIKTKKKTFSDKDFNIITINDKETSITTKIARDFTGFEVIRELYSNALDEGNEEVKIVDEDEIVAEEGRTTFYIQNVEAIKNIYDNWDKYFISERTPMFENINYAVYPSTDKMRIYKKGILIYEDLHYKSVFDYDIKFGRINELRQYIGLKDIDLHNCLTGLDERCIDYFLNNLTDDHYEATMDYSWSKQFNDNWKNVIGNAKIITEDQIKNIKSKGAEIDTTQTVKVPDNLYKALNKQFDGISAVRVADKTNSFYEIYSDELDLKIKKGLSILETCGYNFHPELKFVYGTFGDTNVKAKINISQKEVLISDELLDDSLFNVCATLIEENEHFKTGFEDCTRDFQDHFINLFTKTMFDKNEVEL